MKRLQNGANTNVEVTGSTFSLVHDAVQFRPVVGFPRRLDGKRDSGSERIALLEALELIEKCV